jgi:hypothetical protein
MKKIDIEYYDWLVAQIHIPNGKTYKELFDRLHNLEFVWTVPNDDNRLADGYELRYEFSEKHRDEIGPPFVTLLEVLIGLSRRTSFTSGGHSYRWAWRLLKNLQLTKMYDPLSLEKSDKIDEILYTLVWRTYRWDGLGGFFPLKYPKEDQAKVEIWSQMNAYVMEMKSP